MTKIIVNCFFCTLLFVHLALASKKSANHTEKANAQAKKAVKHPKCDFFHFYPLPSLVFGMIEAEIVNKKKVNESFKIVLNCPTFKILDEPKMSYTVKPGQKEVIIFTLAVNKNEIHKTPEVIKHKCVLTKWSAKSNTLAMCNFDVSIWPYGLFDYPCDDYEEGQLTFIQKSEENHVIVFNLQDSTSKSGLFSVYMVNLTCVPRLPLIERIESINKLRKSKPWDLEIPANCSRLLRQNYVGTCSLKVFNLCHTQITLAVNTSFQLYDGETDECEYLKERLGNLSQHPLAAFFGLNYVETGYLTVVILTQLLVVSITALVIFIRGRSTNKIK